MANPEGHRGRRGASRRLRDDPTHPSLRVHDLGDNDKGRHRRGSRSVSISMQYRAIFVEDQGVNVWYRIGTHAGYDGSTGGK